MPLIAHWRADVLAEYPALAAQPGRRLLFETLRRMLSAQLGDLIDHTQQSIALHAPTDAGAVRHLPPLVACGAAQQQASAELKRFLFEHLYRHPQVVESTNAARTVVSDLFAAYSDRPGEMPDDYAAAGDPPRAVADYIAGMTDRYALREHHRLTGRRLFD